MTEPTLIAIVILSGVFLIMIATIFKGGHEAAIKMWGVMGALTGVAFGSITSFYFTKSKYQAEISELTNKNMIKDIALADAVNNAKEVKTSLGRFTYALEGKATSSDTFSPIAIKFVSDLPRSDVDKLLENLKKNSEKLSKIEVAASNKIENEPNDIEKKK